MGTSVENPYASPVGSLLKPDESEREYRLHLFTARQILAASVIGHIFSASILMAVNYYTITDYKKAIVTVIIGLAFTVVFLLANDAIAVDFMIVYLLIINVIAYLIPRFIFDKYILYEEQIRPTWMVAVVGIVGLILQVFVYIIIKSYSQDTL